MAEEKVCVTGAAGFVASWLIKRLLSAGYHVVGTVRDPGDAEKVAHLWRLEGAKERLRLVAADLTAEGSFDDAIAGCRGVFHTASPVVGVEDGCDPESRILRPAVDGTLNVLRSCKKNEALRRVVLTSSSSAVRARNDFDPAIPLDESSWSSEDLCRRLKIWYALSKTLAEKAAWRFCDENNIDLVTVLASFIIGPSLPSHLSSTSSDVLGLLKGETQRFQMHGRMGYVHIDDVALAHIMVYEKDNAEGRYICSSAVLENDELAAILSHRYPTLPIPRRFEKAAGHRASGYEFDTSKLKRLGMNRYRMPPPPGPYTGKSSLALVARASAFTVGLVYGSVKLKFLKMKAKSSKKTEAKEHH
ncbi:hypothetical protein M569_01100 [Genlisea aurea]|uniref:Dihydroflavonol 4-reductase n=1 Tax=Genlisea aurea TaxID=192259 RepID=S8D2M9_9LAMI|nr:hypothetical protein M569_01100 [Genlisea aurea]